VQNACLLGLGCNVWTGLITAAFGDVGFPYSSSSFYVRAMQKCNWVHLPCFL
jgi:hypothetical protein